ncbi:hypothetical protein Tco_1226580 [Tanacetum coccineum]
MGRAGPYYTSSIPNNDFPEHCFNFAAYDEQTKWANVKNVVLTDYIGHIRSISGINTSGDAITNRTHRRTIDIENLRLSDSRYEMATMFNMHDYESMSKPVVIAASSCWVSRYNGTSATHYSLNPNIPETYHIKHQYVVYLEKKEQGWIKWLTPLPLEREVKGSILTPYKAGGPFLPLVKPEAASLPLVGVGLSTAQPPPYTVEDGIGTHNPWKTVLGVTYLRSISRYPSIAMLIAIYKTCRHEHLTDTTPFLNVNNQQYKDSEQERTINRCPLAALLEVNTQNYQKCTTCGKKFLPEVPTPKCKNHGPQAASLYR